MADNDHKWCFAWFAAKPPTTGQERAALVEASKWPEGAVISISFLDGSDEQKALVRTFADEWPKHANLTFSWMEAPDTDIRISFLHKGSWSVIGTTAKSVTPKDGPTMNFGWLTPGVSDEEARSVVLHEFGHALGLVHEHQNPVGKIKWNKEAVIADLSGPPNGWNADTIERNMFEEYPSNEIAGTKLDWHSIMMYPIPEGWTTDGTSAGFNADLSAEDKAFIAKQYP